MAFVPKATCSDHGIDLLPLPPSQFIARRVEIPVMQGAQGNCEGVRNLSSERTGLRKLKVVRLRRLPPADHTGVRGHKSQVVLVAEAFHLRNSEEALINGSPLSNSSASQGIGFW